MNKYCIITIFLIVLSLQSVFGTTYYTLSDGPWNSTTIWSLDGATSCGCNPSNSISGIEVQITHNISLTSNLTIEGSGILSVLSSGTISGNTNTVVVNSGGFFFNYNVINLKKLTIHSGASSTMTSKQTINDRIEIGGTLNLSGVTSVISGNIYVLSTGVVNILANTAFELMGGNVSNDGTINLSPGSCLSLSAGNIRNNITGTIGGSGYIQAISGNINNDNTWSTSVDWCSGGFSSGMPISPACSGVSSACSLVLPIVYLNVKAEYSNQKISLAWTISGETSNTVFEVEKTKDTQVWELVGTLRGSGNNQQFQSYYSEDNSPYNGVSYYRIKQTDELGIVSYSPIVNAIVSSQNDLILYPNPASNSLTVSLPLFESELLIRIMNSAGVMILESSSGRSISTIDISTFESGIYFINVSNAARESFNKIFIKY